MTRSASTGETPVVGVPLPDQRSNGTHGAEGDTGPGEHPVEAPVETTDGVPDPRAEVPADDADGSDTDGADVDGSDADESEAAETAVVETDAVEADAVASPAEPDAAPISDNRRRAERTAPLFAELATLEKGDPRRDRLREILVE